MKTYKNVEMHAKNAPSGSYAAGCPTHSRFAGSPCGTPYCKSCEMDY